MCAKPIKLRINDSPSPAKGFVQKETQLVLLEY